METNILGYSFDQIKKAQQGGSLNARLPDYNTKKDYQVLLIKR